MALDKWKIEAAQQHLEAALGSELKEIINGITAEPGKDKSLIVLVPQVTDIDLSTDDLADLVAKTSNNYARVARFAGMARAQLKIAERNYKQKYRTSLIGKNKEEREANASEASKEEALELSTIEAIVELAESLENSARVASESARKIFDKARSISIAENREHNSNPYYREAKQSAFEPGSDW